MIRIWRESAPMPSGNPGVQWDDVASDRVGDIFGLPLTAAIGEMMENIDTYRCCCRWLVKPSPQPMQQDDRGDESDGFDHGARLPSNFLIFRCVSRHMR